MPYRALAQQNGIWKDAEVRQETGPQIPRRVLGAIEAGRLESHMSVAELGHQICISS